MSTTHTNFVNCAKRTNICTTEIPFCMKQILSSLTHIHGARFPETVSGEFLGSGACEFSLWRCSSTQPRDARVPAVHLLCSVSGGACPCCSAVFSINTTSQRDFEGMTEGGTLFCEDIQPRIIPGGLDTARLFGAWVRERTIQTERPPLVSEVIANFWA
jgi:hypothetical protein